MTIINESIKDGDIIPLAGGSRYGMARAADTFPDGSSWYWFILARAGSGGAHTPKCNFSYSKTTKEPHDPQR